MNIYAAICSDKRVVIGEAECEEEFIEMLKIWGYKPLEICNVTLSLKGPVRMIDLGVIKW